MMDELIKGFLVAPIASRKFLLFEMGVALLFNFAVALGFIYLLSFSAWDVYWCAPITMLWMTSHFVFNVAALVCKCFFLPRLFF